jgi:hypothetical protein
MINTRPNAWVPWLLGGALVAGTLDITYACVFSYLRRGVPPDRVLKYVASGALGSDALEGGAGAAAAGLFFHYLIAFLFTAFFFAVAARVPRVLERPLLTGALYGIGIYVVMNYVVVPLSRIGPRPTPPTIVWTTGVLVHMFLIGVPIALAARRAFPSGSPERTAVGPTPRVA